MAITEGRTLSGFITSKKAATTTFGTSISSPITHFTANRSRAPSRRSICPERKPAMASAFTDTLCRDKPSTICSQRSPHERIDMRVFCADPRSRFAHPGYAHLLDPLSKRLRHDIDVVDDPAGPPFVGGGRAKPAPLNDEAVMADPVSPIGYLVAIRSDLPELRALDDPAREMAAQTSSILDAPGTLIRLAGNMHPIHGRHDDFERFGDGL